MKKLLLIGIMLISLTSYAMPNDVLSQYVNDRTPAFATLIIKNNQTVFKGVQGCAVLQNGKCVVKATLDTPFSICSVTKHFTDAAILMLEEDGKLSTDDYISRYIPNLPPQFKGIKIKHLIFHISGVPDYVANANVMDFRQMIKQDKKFTESDAFAYILKSKPQPYSKEFVYSNSGYVLLTKIIENVSGESYAQFMQQRFFNRFGMHDAFVMSAIDQHKNYTEAYSPWPLYTPTNWIKAIILSGDSGIFMSINDFEKWVYAFDHNKIFSKKQTMQKFLSIGKYDDGKDVVDLRRTSNKYGYGLVHGEDNKDGKKYNFMGHNGDMPGTTASFNNLSNESESIWVVYLNNAGSYPDTYDILDQAKIKY